MMCGGMFSELSSISGIISGTQYETYPCGQKVSGNIVFRENAELLLASVYDVSE